MLKEKEPEHNLFKVAILLPPTNFTVLIAKPTALVARNRRTLTISYVSSRLCFPLVLTDSGGKEVGRGFGLNKTWEAGPAHILNGARTGTRGFIICNLKKYMNGEILWE